MQGSIASTKQHQNVKREQLKVRGNLEHESKPDEYGNLTKMERKMAVRSGRVGGTVRSCSTMSATPRGGL